MAVSKELRKWNYQQYRKMGFSPKDANKLKNRSIEKTWNEIKEHRRDQHSKGKKPIKYPKVPAKIVSKRVRKTREKHVKLLGAKDKKQSWQKYFESKSRFDGFLKYMEKNGLTVAEALQEIKDSLKKTYDLSEFFKAFRAWYQSTFGIRA